jgi:Zn-finger nucleic acid-binding protein
MVADVHHCPICTAGRGSGKRAAPAASKPACPNCADPLEGQDWDGIAVLMCPTCQGALFPIGGLEKTLDKLREAKEETKLAEVLREFKDRHHRKLAAAVRYKTCPACAGPMTRRNYMDVSGVIVDVCGKHGTWVDQAAFGDLAAFISRGGDVLAARNPLRRKR